jgi:hypothetical protein
MSPTLLMDGLTTSGVAETFSCRSDYRISAMDSEWVTFASLLPVNNLAVFLPYTDDLEASVDGHSVSYAGE